MEPEIKVLRETKLIGMHTRMSLAANKNAELWRSFIPVKKELSPASQTMYAVEVYDEYYFKHFDPAREFEKWAAVEANDPEEIPVGMERLIIPEGLYAVFHLKGDLAAGAKLYQYIFTQWLPSSEFVTDQRPHFAVMDHRYKNNDPESEEEIWIPVKQG